MMNPGKEDPTISAQFINLLFDLHQVIEIQVLAKVLEQLLNLFFVEIETLLIIYDLIVELKARILESSPLFRGLTALFKLLVTDIDLVEGRL